MHYNDNHSVCSNSDNVDEQRHPDYEGGICQVERKNDDEGGIYKQ